MHPTAKAFRAAVEAVDLDALMDTMSDEVVFRSPVTFKTYEGKEAVRYLLSIVMRVFEDFRYVDEVEGERSAILVFETRVGDREVNGIDYLEFGEDGRIERFTVMVRPMSAVTRLAESIGAELAKG